MLGQRVLVPMSLMLAMGCTPSIEISAPPDGEEEAEDELWFTHGAGAPEIWRSLKVEGDWPAPEKVVGPFAGEPTFDADGNLYFTHHFWDDDEQRIIEADIHIARRK
jgi:hypothetical protein